jgi:hypothetical protein
VADAKGIPEIISFASDDVVVGERLVGKDDNSQPVVIPSDFPQFDAEDGSDRTAWRCLTE